MLTRYLLHRTFAYRSSIVAILVVPVVLTTIAALPVLAASCAQVNTGVISCDDNKNGVFSLLLLVINILTAGVGLVAIGGFVYGAILYTTAEGDSGKVTKAKETIFNVTLGLVAFALANAFLQFIVPGGVFDRSISLPEAAPPPAMQTSSSAGDSSQTGAQTGASAGAQTGSTGLNSSLASIQTLPNFRDASGSGVLKSGVLYRSGKVNGLSANDKATLASALNGGTIINLSSPNDINIPGVKQVHIALMGITDTTPLVTNADQRTKVGQVLKTLANANTPVLVHCTHGKDRTGWITAMVMYAAGASDAQVQAEYLKSPNVQAGWLANGIQAIRNKYPKAKNPVLTYFKKGCGLSDADIQNLKNKYGA